MDPRKYPRTPHLPWSRSSTSDDVFGTAFEFLKPGVEAVVTEKMDGENTTIYSHGMHARSLDSNFHPSRSWVANLAGSIGWQLPAHRRIVLENVYAEHSIRYEDLPTFAYAICVIDLLDEAGEPSLEGAPTVLSWDASLAIYDELGLTPVPLLYRGEVTNEKLQEIFEGLDHSKQEGIVVRSAGSFLEEAFSTHVAKAVRARHVQTDDHWLRTWRPNALKESDN